MKTLTRLVWFTLLSLFVIACGNSTSEQTASRSGGHGEAVEEDVIKGPHGGRILRSGDFVIELSIFETGVPPEFRAWASLNDKQLKPNDIKLDISLTRLGGKVDSIKFKPLGDVLRGDSIVYEPHSFAVSITAEHAGKKYHWQYDNFEGRTKIETSVADALEIKTSIAGPVVLQETIKVFGKVRPSTEHVSHVKARFVGVMKSVSAVIGDTVQKGQVLATVESNESLNVYAIKAPISGVITQRNINPGEQSGARTLFTIIDTGTVWVDLSVFPGDRQRVKVGAPVTITITNTGQSINGHIGMLKVTAEKNQAVIARAVVDHAGEHLLPGSHVKAQINVAEHPVRLAVKRSGLQAFRDFTVVFAKIGEEYEVRMLELGRQDSDWIEVLGGLEIGTRYVSENSYVIKADIEKSGATHDH